jgi:tripartite ATP-independent transporter DctP family solute receptor
VRGKKNWLLMVVLLMAVAILAACGGGEKEPAASNASQPAEKEAAPAAAPAEPKKEIKMKMSVTTSDTSSWYEGAQMWADTVKEKTNGQVEIKIYPNEQLSNGNQAKGIEMLQGGSTDASLHSTIIYSVVDQKFSVVSMPWLLPTNEKADQAMEGKGGEMLKELVRSKGVEPLAFGENGFRQITNSKVAITSPDDMKGLKIRVPGMAMYLDLFKELGADPTAMNFAEVFTSLQQGTIDGQENPLNVITSSKLYEVQDHISLWNYSYDPLVLGVNKELYDSLDPETQTILRDAAVEAMAYQKKINREADAELLQLLKDEGMTVTELSDEQVKAFQDKMSPVYDKYTDIIGKDLLDAFRSN